MMKLCLLLLTIAYARAGGTRIDIGSRKRVLRVTIFLRGWYFGTSGPQVLLTLFAKLW